MIKPHLKKCCIILVLLAAVASFILLLVKCNEADVTIAIGFPAQAETAAIDYTSSKPISDKQTVNRILLALLSGKPLTNSAAPNTPPDAVMMIQFKEENIAYQFSVWVDQPRVIYAMETGDEAVEYRVIDNLTSEEFRVLDRVKVAKS